jgi:TonB family protein
MELQTMKSIQGAKIKIIGTNNEVTTDSLGYFTIKVENIDSATVESIEHEPVKVKLPKTNNFFITLKNIKPENEDEAIYSIVDEPTYFPGDFYNYVNKSLKYPNDAKKGKVSGRVFVEFVVDTAGVIMENKIRVAKSLFRSCDEEAIRLIKESPNWIPARQRGKKVRQKMVLPITF